MGSAIEKIYGATKPVIVHGKAVLYQEDCFEWLEHCRANSIHAVVTDPPYGLVEYTEKEQWKLRNGKGGVWAHSPILRRPPAIPIASIYNTDRH